MNNYTSFLICFHDGHTDIFRDGLPIGVIRDGRFDLHQQAMPDGTKQPISIEGLRDLKRRVFEAVVIMPDTPVNPKC